MVKAFKMTAPQIKIDAKGIANSVNNSMRDAVRRIVMDPSVGMREVY
jgi:hypothetical protein